MRNDFMQAVAGVIAAEMSLSGRWVVASATRSASVASIMTTRSSLRTFGKEFGMPAERDAGVINDTFMNRAGNQRRKFAVQSSRHRRAPAFPARNDCYRCYRSPGDNRLRAKHGRGRQRAGLLRTAWRSGLIVSRVKGRPSLAARSCSRAASAHTQPAQLASSRWAS